MSETLQQPIDPESLNSGLLGCAALACLTLIVLGAAASLRLSLATPAAAWPTTRAEIGQSAEGPVFVYTVEGVPYEAPARTRIFTPLPDTRSATVHYNPTTPSRAILLPRDAESPSAIMLAGPFIALAGAGGLVWLFRYSERSGRR